MARRRQLEASPPEALKELSEGFARPFPCTGPSVRNPGVRRVILASIYRKDDPLRNSAKGNTMPITDHFDSFTAGPTGPVTGGFDITPNDGADLPTLPRALMVAGGGDIAVVMQDGTSLTLPGLAAGVIYPVRTSRILATGTTATGIKGLY